MQGQEDWGWGQQRLPAGVGVGGWRRGRAAVLCRKRERILQGREPGDSASPDQWLLEREQLGWGSLHTETLCARSELSAVCVCSVNISMYTRTYIRGWLPLSLQGREGESAPGPRRAEPTWGPHPWPRPLPDWLHPPLDQTLSSDWFCLWLGFFQEVVP